MTDIADRLRAMMARGFRFLHPRDENGDLVAVTGISVHDGVIDLLQLYGEDDAQAVRMPADETDIFFPRTVLWRTSGPAADVIQELLNLPEPATAHRARRRELSRGGCWVPARPGRQRWLAASS
ncbi:hypothetical protein [Actinoalloteichus spitiensis]|uniref:hypothetical protein n=1 Tax=Actinoalloteichus spitiensis TaxID=252394 RepID=UPI0012F6ECFF|nr:hypothetical protein [Actinoalloteichus spitiensis]